MKYKSYLVLIILCFIGLNASAQQVTFGPKYEETKYYFANSITGKYGNGFFIIHQRMEDAEDGNIYIRINPIIEKFDFSCNSLFSKEIHVYDSGSTKKEMIYDHIYGLKDNMVCIMYNRDLSRVYGIKINGDGIADSNNHVLLGSIINSNGTFEHGLPEYRYHFTISPDSTTFLAYYYKKDSSKVHCVVFDENLRQLWSKDLVVPLKGKDMFFNKCIYNGSEVVFRVDLLETKEQKSCDAIFMYDKNTDATSFEKLNIASHENTLTSDGSLLFAMNKNGDIVMAGVYSTDKNTDDPVGICCINIDKNSAHIPEPENILLPPEYLNAYQTHKLKCKRNWVNMKHLVLTEDKNIFFGAEEMGYDQFGIYLGDAVIGEISSNDKLEWVKKIPKRQVLENVPPGFHGHIDKRSAILCYSYKMSITDDKIILMYNEQKDNLKTGMDDLLKNEDLIIPTKEIYSDKDTWNICLVTIDFSGNSIKRYCLNENEADPLKYPPNLIHSQLTKKSFVFFRADGTMNLLSVPNTKYQLAELNIE